MFLTACYIVKNESRNLAESLATIRPLADRIIVVDTGSKDDTAEVARSFDAEVLPFAWQDDFAAARNYALDHVPSSADREDWILFLDADESLPHAAGFRAMVERLASARPAAEGVLLTLVNVDADAEDLEIGRFHALRLWRHRPQYRYRGAIHEALVDVRTGRPPEPCVVDDAFLVRHTGYSSARVRQKLLRNLVMLKAEVRAHGEQPLTLRYFADCYYGLRQYAQAAAYARRALDAHVATVAGDRDLYDVLLRSLQKLGRPLAEQQAVVDEALAHLAGAAQAEFLGWRGRLRLAAGDAAGAHEDIAKSLSYAADDADAGSSGWAAAQAELAAADASALLSLGRRTEAGQQAMRALASNPYDEAALAVLADILPDAAAFLAQVLPFYRTVQHGASFVADFAERQMLPELRVAAAAPLADDERAGRAPVTSLFAQAAAGDDAALSDGLPAVAAQAVQELFAALVQLQAPERQAQPERVAAWQASLPAAMQHLLACLQSPETEALQPGDADAFFTGLAALDGLATEDALLPYARLAAGLGTDAVLRTAHWLHDRRMERAAFDLLQRVPSEALADDETAADFWYLAGRALHALGEAGARECFERAQAAGCQNPRLAFYLSWTGEQGKEQEA